MANWQKIKTNALASVDTAIHIAQRMPEVDENNNQNIDFSYNNSINPFPFLLDLLRRFCGYNYMIKIIARFIAYSLPAVEIAVKAALLANLKNLLYCTIDPRFKNNEVLRSGITVDLDDIDVLHTLQYCPLNTNNLFGTALPVAYKNQGNIQNLGSVYYYGCDGFTYPSELVDAGDFNAFLWYVINRSNKREVWRGIDTKGKNVLNALHQSERFGTNSTDSFLYQRELEPRPTGDEQDTKENGILTLIYYGDGMTSPRDYKGDPLPDEIRRTDTLQVYIGNVSRTDLDDREFKNFEKVYQQQCTKVFDMENDLSKLKKEKENLEKKIRKKKDTENIDSQKATLERLSDKIKKLENELSKAHQLTETYAKEYEQKRAALKETYSSSATAYRDIKTNYYYDKTLMRFNYDYLMSIKLFDSKVVAAQLIDVLFNNLSTININFSYSRKVIEEEVKKMVESVLERGDTVISDCFFAFSNRELDNLQRKIELQRAGLFSLNGESDTIGTPDIETLYNNINNIASNATEQEIQATIEGTLTNISKEFISTSSTVETESNFKNPVKWDFINSLIENLMVIIVQILCSPKVYLVYLINMRMLGEPDDKFNLEKFLQFKGELVAASILKIRDIWADYLTMVFKGLSEKLEQLVRAKLINEQYEDYRRLLLQCIECFKMNKKYLDFNLDDVDYADILSEEITNNENNGC